MALTQQDLDNIADAVWNEAANNHKTGNTFGHWLNLVKKASTIVEGKVTSAITPTRLTFSTDVSAAAGAYRRAVLLMTSGAKANENSPIASYASSNGVIVLEKSLTGAPATNDEFVIIAGSHVHSINEIAEGVRGMGVGVRATQADDGTISLYRGSYYDGTAHPKLQFTTTKDYTAASSITFKVYDRENATLGFKSEQSHKNKG